MHRSMLYEASSHIFVSKFNWMIFVQGCFLCLLLKIAHAFLANIILPIATRAGLAADEEDDSTPIA